MYYNYIIFITALLELYCVVNFPFADVFYYSSFTVLKRNDGFVPLYVLLLVEFPQYLLIKVGFEYVHVSVKPRFMIFQGRSIEVHRTIETYTHSGALAGYQRFLPPDIYRNPELTV